MIAVGGLNVTTVNHTDVTTVNHTDVTTVNHTDVTTLNHSHPTTFNHYMQQRSITTCNKQTDQRQRLKLQLANGVERVHILLRHGRAALLELVNERLHLADQDLLHLAREHAAGAVLLADALQLLVVLQKVLQVLVRNVLRQVRAQRALLLLRLAAAAVRVPVDLCLTATPQRHLVLDLVGRVRHVNARVGA